MQTDKIAIIAGCTGTLGAPITEELKKQDYQVYGGSRTKGDFHYTNEQLIQSAYWYEIIGQHAQQSSEVVLINTIGQASPPNGLTLDDVNVRPVVALAKAGKEFAANHPGVKVTVVQISAIAALYLQNDAYGISRAKADRKVVKLGNDNPLNNYKTLVLQLPFIYVEPQVDLNKLGNYVIKGLHPWSMEQIAGLPIVPLAGWGKQIVYPVNLKDVTAAIARASTLTNSLAIEVKGGSALTQKELINFYAKLRNKSIVCVPMPSSILGIILDQFPHGLLAGYAPRVMSGLSDIPSRDTEEPFDKLLGRSATTIEEDHKEIKPTNVRFASPPIADHLLAHAGKIIKISLMTLLLTGGTLLVAKQLSQK